MEIRPLKTDEEIAEAIRKNYGGDYASYRKAQLDYDSQPIVKAQPIQKSASEIFMDGCEVVAKHRGQSLAEFFKHNPADYEKYRALGFRCTKQVPCSAGTPNHFFSPARALTM